MCSVVVGSILLLGACTGEDATPLDELDEIDGVPGGEVEAPNVTHALEPNDEMRDLAEQQCLDDPDLEVGEISAVDPDDPDQVLLTVTVDCADLR